MKLLNNSINYFIFLILFFLLFISSYFSPSELILRDLAKIVYLHGSLVWVGLIYFTLIAFISIYNIFFNNKLYNYLFIIEEIVIVFWISSTFIGLILAYVSWGGILWVEPRVISSLVISIISIIIYFILVNTNNKIINNILSISQILIILILFSASQNIFHPVNSILQSDFVIQSSFLIQLIILLLISINILIIRIRNFKINHI